MNKPLIDGRKLDQSPSFVGPSISPKANGFSFSQQKSSAENPMSSEVEKDKKERRTTDKMRFSTASGKMGFEGLDQSDRASTREDLASLDSDPIFTRLCPKDQLRDDPNCIVCNKALGGLKIFTKKNCKFCGGCVCEEHGRKKRPNPQNPSEHAKICDKCDEKHIKRIILKEFDEKMRKKDRDLNDLEKMIKDQQLSINDAQREYDHLLVQKARNDKNYADQIAFLTNDISQIKEETRKCEKENTLLTKDFNDTQKKVEQLDNRIQEAQQEYERLQLESGTLNKQIEAVNQDINQITKQMMEIEEMLTREKIDQGNNSANHYSKSQIQNFSAHYNQSYQSSLMSERTEKVRSNNDSQRMKKNKFKKDDDSLSISNPCDVKCNIF